MVSGGNSRMKRPAHQRIRRPCSHLFRVTDLPSWGSSSSLHDDLSRVLRVKAKPLRGRFASHDTAGTAKRWQLQEDRGRNRNQRAARRAIRVRHWTANHGHRRDITVGQRLGYCRRRCASSQLRTWLVWWSGAGSNCRPSAFQAGAPSPADRYKATVPSGRAVAAMKGRLSSVTFPGAEGYELGERRSCSAYRPGTSCGTCRRYGG